GKHEPLFSRETFEKVQQVAQVHDRAGDGHRVHHHYLKGSLFCARCGSRMTVARAKGHGGTYLYLFCYFFCLGRQFRYGGCDSRYVAVERVEDWIGNYYSITQLEEERVDDVRAQLLKELEQQRSRTARGVKR